MTHRPSSCELCVRTALRMGMNPSDLREPICGNKYPSDPFR